MSLKKLDIEAVKNQDISILNEPLNKEKTSKDQTFEHVYLGNIPSAYHSSDLRWFFKDSVEKQAFRCFHFRHRPEKQIIVAAGNRTQNINNEAQGSKPNDEQRTFCCVLQIYTDHVDSLIGKYHSKEWRRKDLTFAKRTVVIRKLKVKLKSDNDNMYKSKKEKRLDKHLDNQEVYIEDLYSSIELNPPKYIMPNGNVGTTTKYFHGLIKECKMPPSLIKSLDLEFPTTRKLKAYSNVPMDYDLLKKKCKQKIEDTVDFSIVDVGEQLQQNLGDSNLESEVKNPEAEHIKQPHGSKLKSEFKSKEKRPSKNVDSPDEEDEAEDWERHEALHDDVDNQARPKERLYEEDIELKWEKGGSGLVFYTDAYLWNELKGKDFDEDTVDDWDVDYSIYYEDGAGDKPAQDQYNIYKEKKLRQASLPIKASQLRRKENFHRKQMTTKFAEFEKYSNAFGSKILKSQGWKEGAGVGVSTQGISEPITLDGQGPSSRIGFGFYGDKLDRTVNLKRKVDREIRITTKYDDEEV